MALRDFLGYALTEGTPDHSTLSRTRRLLSLETHQAVFTWVLGVLADAKLLRGDTHFVGGMRELIALPIPVHLLELEPLCRRNELHQRQRMLPIEAIRL